MNGDGDKVQALVQEGVDVNIRNKVSRKGLVYINNYIVYNIYTFWENI